MRAPERTPERTRLADTPVFFDVGRLEEAGLKVVQRRYEPGETVFMVDDPADRLYLLVEGLVRVCKAYGNYHQATVELLKDCGGFGEFDLFGKGQQSASAETLTYCWVASIRKEDLRYAMKHHPWLVVDLFSMFSEKFRHSEQAIEVLLHRQIDARLLALLPVLADRFGYPAEAEPVIPLSQSELAEMVASTREAVSKTLNHLRREGLIELGMRKITIKDHAGLREHAASSGVSLAHSGVSGLLKNLNGV